VTSRRSGRRLLGSLLRLPDSARARGRLQGGPIAAKPRAAEDEAIRGVIEPSARPCARSPQEFRRTSWHMDFIYSLDGITQVEGSSIHVQFRSAEGEYDYAPPAMRVSGRVGVSDTIFD
jgi:5-methyltetrahydropteroyltriglutamate--homocysteine methyltransferase